MGCAFCVSGAGVLASLRSLRRSRVPSPSGTQCCPSVAYPALTCGANECRRFATLVRFLFYLILGVFFHMA
jgi:hypothetical protein